MDAKKQAQTPFMDRVLKNTDLVMYRFGKQIDEKEVQRIKQGGTYNVAELTSWLKPDKKNIKLPDGIPADKQGQARLDMEDLIEQLLGGTNVAGSVNAAAKLENNTFLQAIIVFSDGNSNSGSDESLHEFLDARQQSAPHHPSLHGRRR